MGEKNNPVISVVIPVYNGEQYLRDCLQNILGQSYDNLEVIVIDDGSTDHSAAIAAEYPVKLIRHGKNRGLSAARNTGIDAAQGAYLHFMDVDDGLSTDYYLHMFHAIRDTGADMACGGMVNEKQKSKSHQFKARKVYTSVRDKLEVTYAGKLGYVVRYLFRTTFIRRHGFRFEEGRFIGDRMFSLPAVYHAEKLVTVPDTAYIYYYRENSIMTNRDQAHRRKRAADRKYAKQFCLEFAKKHDIAIPGVTTGRIKYIVKKFTAWIGNLS